MEERTTEIRREPPPPWYRENWWVFLVALLLIVGGIIAYFALRDTGGGEERERVQVPDVVGLPEADARATLAELGLRVEVVRQPSDEREGIVVAQQPSAGSRIAEGGRVTITVSTGPQPTQTETVTETETETVPEEQVAMPDVRGAEHDDAVEDLVDAGLLPETFPVESGEERGIVVEQEPGPGGSVATGSIVRLDVSLGAGDRNQLQVPDLVGLEPAQALEECARAGFTCRLGADGGPERRVTSQRPAAGTAAPELSQIRLSQD